MDGTPNELSNVDTGGSRQCMANGVPHAAGEAFRYCMAAAAAGDPPASPRGPATLDELVSLEAAHRDYGVVLTGSLESLDLAVDAEATRRLRAERR
jgi:hypothetical protein